jgi:isoquinoline 1-oxidoreductase beta subunit
MGGGFGRRLGADFSVEAALIARALNGTPVQLLWSREDDLQNDFYRPCSQHQLRASLNSEGEPEAWVHHLASPAIFAALQMPPASDRPGVYEATGAADMPYRVINRRCAYSLLPSRVPRGFWRAVSATHTVFAVESFIDELAAAAGRDALEYRLSLIDRLPDSLPLRDTNFPFQPERLKAVLLLAAERAGWNRRRPAGRGLGIACCWDHLSYVAQAIEVSLPDPLQIQVHRVVTAIDCGLVINPDGVRAQVEGSVVQGLSAALRERVQIADGGVQQSNFHDYPILRLAESPPVIEVLLRASAEAPTGAGEPALPAVAPALANAIFSASGRRLRNLPLDRQTLSLP